MSNPNERLDAVQAQLVERGVKDVKFCFAKGVVSSLSSLEVAEKVAAFLESYLKGEGVMEVKLLNDAPQPAAA